MFNWLFCAKFKLLLFVQKIGPSFFFCCFTKLGWYCVKVSLSFIDFKLWKAAHEWQANENVTRRSTEDNAIIAVTKPESEARAAEWQELQALKPVLTKYEMNWLLEMVRKLFHKILFYYFHLENLQTADSLFLFVNWKSK